jgi:hypothetical protein
VNGSNEPAVSSEATDGAGVSRPLSFDWWAGGRGLGGVAQWPNPAIGVWAIASALRLAGITDEFVPDRLLHGIASGALLVWALDELLRGVSPLRRLMGILVLGAIAVAFLG